MLVAIASTLADPALAQSSPFECVSASWANAVVLVPPDAAVEVGGGSLQSGDRLAALAPDGSCVGVATWTPQGAALSIWADDFMTSRVDGLREGDPLTLVALTGQATTLEAAVAVEVTFDPSFRPTGGFQADGLYVVASAEAPEATASPVPGLSMGPPYPNPVTDRAHVPFSLDVEADVTVEVFDALGRQVATLADGPLGAGNHRVTFDAAGLSAGVYLVRLRAGGAVSQGQVVVSR